MTMTAIKANDMRIVGLNRDEDLGFIFNLQAMCSWEGRVKAVATALEVAIKRPWGAFSVDTSFANHFVAPSSLL